MFLPPFMTRFPKYRDHSQSVKHCHRKDGITVLNQDLLITVFDTGLGIPPQHFVFKGQLVIHPYTIALQIRSLPVDTQPGYKGQ
jgi:hypothetical protein